MIAFIPAVVALAGALVYGFGSGKGAELGRTAFGCGLLVELLTLAHHVVRIG